MMLDQHSTLYDTFRWHTPQGFNLAQACCQRWAELPSHERRAAIIDHTSSEPSHITFAQLTEQAAKLANGLARLGVIPGDRVAIVMTSPIPLITLLMACWQLHAIAVPLPATARADALVPLLRQARCQIAVIDGNTEREALAAIARCSRISQVVGYDTQAAQVMNWRGLVARQNAIFTPNPPSPLAPALMVWPQTSSVHFPEQTALLLAHQALVGNLPGFVACNDWFPDQAHRLATTLPVWHETALMSAILPALYFGHTVILLNEPDPQAAEEITHLVSDVSSVCRWIKKNEESALAVSGANLKSLCLLGGFVDKHWREHIQRLWQVTPNLATYVSGSGLVIGQSHQKWPSHHDTSGRIVPGHQVRVDEPSGSLAISRITHQGQTDPAQYIQIWLPKDAPERVAPIDLPEWYQPGLMAKLAASGDITVLGPSAELIRVQDHTFALTQLEQAILAKLDIDDVVITESPHKKNQQQATPEWWVLIQPRNYIQTSCAQWLEDTSQQIIGLILTACAANTLSEIAVHIRIGRVQHIGHLASGESDRTSASIKSKLPEIDFFFNSSKP